MVCLCDNDFILCLATFDLVEEALEILGITRQHIKVLPSAKYKIRTLRQNNSVGVDKALEFIATVNQVSQIPGIILDQHLAKVDGIDAGEKLLLATALECTDFLLATGDKTFLRRLAKAPEYKMASVHLCNRVVCIEHVVKAIINRYGCDYVKEKVVPVRDHNTSIKSAFGSGMLATHDNVIASLDYKINELRLETGNILI